MIVDCMYCEQAGPATRINTGRFILLHNDGQRLVRGWFDKACSAMNDENESFEAFIFAWFAINGWAACVTGKDRDADYIRALQRSTELAVKFQALLESDAHFFSTATSFQSYWPIFKAQDIRRAGYHSLETMNRQDVVKHYFERELRVYEPQCWKSHQHAGEQAPLDWPHTLAAIYRVRCNLFHGEKSAHSEMDRAIVRCAYLTLIGFFSGAEIL